MQCGVAYNYDSLKRNLNSESSLAENEEYKPKASDSRMHYCRRLILETWDYTVYSSLV